MSAMGTPPEPPAATPPASAGSGTERSDAAAPEQRPSEPGAADAAPGASEDAPESGASEDAPESGASEDAPARAVAAEAAGDPADDARADDAESHDAQADDAVADDALADDAPSNGGGAAESSPAESSPAESSPAESSPAESSEDDAGAGEATAEPAGTSTPAPPSATTAAPSAAPGLRFDDTPTTELPLARSSESDTPTIDIPVADLVAGMPRRPTSTDPSELGFTPQQPVHWLSPTMLANTAGQVLLSSVFGEFLDKRELQGSLPDVINDERPGAVDDTEVWFDYVADLGDGFDPTYTIAYLLAQDAIEVDAARLPRGHFLMMGGDEIYPTPSSARYDDRTSGPYRAALPQPPPEGSPALYALPGNHDWYDGLSSFMRLFVQSGRDHVGGWRSAQSRSYFAIRLPHRWWLLAIDTQFGAYIDRPQLDYFHRVAAEIQPGDRVIVCTPTPSWVEASWDAGAYDTADFFVRTVIAPTGADIKLMLSGDLHHYAHYHGAHRELVHCGGGGAYLYPTHRMPDQIPVPPPPAKPHHVSSEPTQRYDLTTTFPTKAQSTDYAFGVFGRTLTRNPGFIGFVGTAHLLFMVSLIGLFEHTSELTRKWLELPIALTALILLGGAIAFAMSPTGGSGKTLRRLTLGGIHGLISIGLGIGMTALFAATRAPHGAWPLPILFALIYLAVVGTIAVLIFCVYMLVASEFGVNLNELFSAQSIIDSKSFLRLHIDASGTLNIYPIAVPTVAREWVANPTAQAPHASWLDPSTPVGYRLIEGPITVR